MYSLMNIPAKCSSQQLLVKIVWPILIVSFLVFWVFMQSDIRKASIRFFKPEFFTAEPVAPLLSSIYYLVNTEGCRIQMMDAFDMSIMEYLVDKDNINENNSGERPIRCPSSGLPPLVYSNLTHIFTNESSIAMHNLTELNCCYQPFWRKSYENISAKVGQIDTEFVNGDKCIDFNSSAFMGDNEFIKVLCTSHNTSNVVYTDFHSFTPIKHTKSNGTSTSNNKISVFILGVDAVSRLNLIRQMPKTVDFIKDELHGVEMLGYNKVGDNTFPNLVPVLVGLSISELEKLCWPNSNTYFDNCPFIWKNFSKAGYKTMFAEDASWMGIFNYVKSGFFKQPTDYYWGTYNRRVENEIGSDHRMNAKLCSGYRSSIDTLLEYGKKFALTMSKNLFFGFVWGASLSHDYLNLPMYGDDLHRDFLKYLQKNGILNNSVLIFMSDHGIRWGGIRSTYQGYLEERLPFLYIVLPSWFRKKYATAIGYLRMNTRKLTSPFDLHKTLADLLNLDELKSESIKRRIINNVSIGKGISLFLPIPSNRTCESAGIPNDWCTCHSVSEAGVNDTLVAEAAENLVDHVNTLLEHEKQCAHLTLKKVLSAHVAQTVPKNEKGEPEKLFWVRDYIISIETEPGKAHFEATVRYNTYKKFKTMGTVSRTNTYGNQSICISNYKLRLYCFCTIAKPTVPPR